MPKESFLIWVVKHRNIKEIVGRILDVFVGYLLLPISYITIRNKRKWVFGNKTGFSDNSKYLFLYIQEKYATQVRCIWIAASHEEENKLKNLSFEVYRKWSLRGLFHTLTAGVYMYSSFSSDINYWTSGRAIKFNMWHGVGIKKLGTKGTDIYNQKDLLKRFITPFHYEKPTFFLAPSDLMKEHFLDCYSLPEKCMCQVGYPRCDFLTEDPVFRGAFVKKYESEKTAALIESFSAYEQVFIYMPTFRDNQSDFIHLSGIDFVELDSILREKHYLLLLKMHPATRMNFSLISSCTNIQLLDKKMDIYPILPETDVLITDYSSIYYDYILLRDKRVILFPFDYEEYKANSRDLAYDYMQYTPGEKVWNYEELKNAITSVDIPPFPQRQWVIDTFWGRNYANSSDKIISLLFNKTK